MKSAAELQTLLRQIDHKSYPAYKDTRGQYQFQQYVLSIDHVQGDPFAAPSKVSLLIPGRVAGFDKGCYEEKHRRIAFQDYLLRRVAAKIKEYSFKAKGSGKSGLMGISQPGQEILERSACWVNPSDGQVTVRMEIGFPANGRTINAGELVRILFDFLPVCVKQTLLAASCPRDGLERVLHLADDQLYIRRQLKERELVAFVADGAILPRRSGVSSQPMKDAVAFVSPQEMAVTMQLPHRGALRGMGIRRGVTLIVGGGYHGKSTLLEALEKGVYDHIAGDGREYVLTDDSAMKLRAEDGRSIQQADISMFIRNLPGGKDTGHFYTEDASGSTSQAAATVEAVEMGAKAFLIDEDTSATNFMIRDRLMRRLVRKEPIIPYTDRVEELKERGVSTILVIGGSGEYLEYGDCVLLMEDYRVYDRTSKIRELLVCPEGRAACSGGAHGQKEADPEPTDRESGVISKREAAGGDGHIWMERKTLPRELCCGEAPCSRTVGIDHGRYIRLGEITADITRLTAVGAAGQVHTLAWLLEKLLSQDLYKEADLRVCCEQLVQSLFEDSADVILSSRGHAYEFWLEEVRGLDLLMAAARLRKSC